MITTTCLPVAAYPALIKAVTSRPDYPASPALVGSRRTETISDLLAEINSEEEGN
jgi:hypothetical protein